MHGRECADSIVYNKHVLSTLNVVHKVNGYMDFVYPHKGILCRSEDWTPICSIIGLSHTE